MDYKVTIIGGGPSGSTTAIILAENEISTIIIDKSKFLRDKVCVGGLIFHTFTNFPHSKPFIENYNYSVSVYSPSF
ncbi:MAG: NAD(P)/FAD-dependent oxidoreductase [Candidatus Helarchaeota archaeon]